MSVLEWVCESACVWVSVCDDVMCVCESECEWVSVSECEWVCESERVCVSVWVNDVCEWEGGRRSGGRSGIALKIKTPHANVGEKPAKKKKTFLWDLCQIYRVKYRFIEINLKNMLY